MRKNVPAGSVDGYLATLPEEVRVALERFRKITRAAAPDTTETISYRVPVFKLHGRPLVGFGAAKNHCSFFTMSSSMIPKLGRRCEPENSKGTRSAVPRSTSHLTGRSRPPL